MRTSNAIETDIMKNIYLMKEYFLYNNIIFLDLKKVRQWHQFKWKVKKKVTIENCAKKEVNFVLQYTELFINR